MKARWEHIILTNEEAEQLIAEIKKLYMHEWSPVQCESKLTTELTCLKVEKIIKSFGNKPPKNSGISYWNGLDTGRIILTNNHNNVVAMDFEDIEGHRIGMHSVRYNFNIEQLKQLHDNITLMLEHLENE